MSAEPEQGRFDLGWRDEAATTVELAYRESRWRSAAVRLAVCHPRAIQYIEQAPLIVIAECRRLSSERAVTNAPPAVFTEMCRHGAPLAKVMAIWELPLPLRKVQAHLFDRRVDVVTLTDAVARLLSPSALGQFLPNTCHGQTLWLRQLTIWLRCHRRGRHREMHLEWAARYALEVLTVPGADMRDIGDFAHNGDRDFNPKWSVSRAVREAREWHERLRLERHAVNDRQVDFWPVPDSVDVEGFTFRILRTVAEISAEGDAMHHCVRSYIPVVSQGLAHIVSVRRDGDRVATLEMLPNGVIAQLKGKCNAQPKTSVSLAARAYGLFLRKLNDGVAPFLTAPSATWWPA